MSGYEQKIVALPADIGRTLPHSVEAEMGVLGSMLISPNNVIAEVVEHISEDYFYIPAHQTIFTVAVEFWNTSAPFDLITFTQVLRDRNILDAVGGVPFVTSVFNFVPTAAMVGYYLEIVREKYVLRQLIAAGTEVVRRAYEEQDETRELVDAAQEKMTAIALDHRTASPVQHVLTAVEEALEEVEAAHKHRGTTTGLATGFVDLDRTTLGLNDGDLIVLGARPSMGKTSFAMQIAQNVATDHIEASRAVKGKPVLIFSIETAAKRLMLRALCARSSANIQDVRRGGVSREKLAEIREAAVQLSHAPIYIDESAALRTFEFKARARQAVSRYGVGLIIIDYGQLMKSPSKRAELSKQVEMADVSVAVKEIARGLDIPIILLLQLKREVENRRDAKPRMSDLKESGQFEQDADQIWFLHRDDYYLPEGSPEREAAEGRAKLIIAKQKDGPTDELELSFEKEFARFGNTPSVDGTHRPFFALMYSNNAGKRQQM